MKYDIKLIGLDLDGTVFNEKKQISDRTINAISKAIEKGVTVIPATGRPYGGLPNEFTSIPGVRYALTANGSSIIDLMEKKVIYSNLIDVKAALDIIDELLTFDAIIDIFIDGTGYSPKSSISCVRDYMHTEEMADYFIKTRLFYDNDAKTFIRDMDQPIEKIQLLFKDISKKEKASEILKAHSDFAFTSALTNNIEINSVTANKGDGLLGLGTHLGIKREQIMACGDSYNDYEMIKSAGLGIAMGNATKDIKEIADFITLTNEEDGVAYAIEKYILSI
ncbi:hypothetical protein EDD66_102471 [Mobilisporobacter senegalensis]|uniref:Cof subfamily protein (Haloacid dehalogenase superfamily)/HAD superfamily hydrolase (TIGR01484 family) n=1 Tax=Mobilisporobacter senegalensis TaxID=1329262 RepID=A0A3N1XW11_9FIRM|nr:Cof-type HAD-IIB family hydrolase [Mobilisporobacter senegalensis]ROR30815.1 hypothetical protein EDD66_102471 [Mobilisporobacter senegalensis]